MGFGSAFNWAWETATEASHAATSGIATGAEWIGQKSSEAAEWTKDQIVSGAEWTKDQVVSGAEWTKDQVVSGAKWTEKQVVRGVKWTKKQAIIAAEWSKKQAIRAAKWAKKQAIKAGNWVKYQAIRAKNYAKDKTRDAVRVATDGIFNALGLVGEYYRNLSNSVGGTYNKIKGFFFGDTLGNTVEKCPLNEKTDLEVDGVFMSPKGKGQKCARTNSSEGADSARAKSILSPNPCCEKKRAAGEPTRTIIYVNGINTTSSAHCTTLNAIAEQTCARVIGVYNATAGDGGFSVRDAAQTAQDRRLINAANEGKPISRKDGRNPAVDTLRDVIINEIAGGANPEIWAHSQGGAVSSLALHAARDTLAIQTGSADPLAGSKVVSMGSAAPMWPDGPQYQHFIHVNDATPTSFGLGHNNDNDLKNAGKNAEVVRFSGDSSVMGTKFDEINPETSWLPAGAANHGVEDTYLKMEKQKNGGC